MFILLKFYGRRFWSIPLLIVMLLIVNQFKDSGLDNISNGLLIVWTMYWNLSEKSEKSWRFFQALPVTFFEKVLVKVALPFFLGCMLWLMTNEAHPLNQIVDGSVSYAIVTLSGVILASIIASGTVSAILWLGFFVLIQELLPDSGQFAVACTVLYLTAAIVFLSEKRIPWKGALLKAAAVCLPFVIMIHFARVPILNIAVRSGSPELRLIAAEQLIDHGQKNLAASTVEEILQSSSDIELLKSAVSILEDSDLGVEVSRESWLKILALDSDMREDILEHMRRNKEKFQWIDVDFLRLVEVDAINRGCEDDCQELARLVGGFSATGGLGIDDYIKSRLKSFEEEKIIFGLRSVQNSNVSSFQAEILKLLEHNNRDVRDEAEKTLQDTVGKTVDLSRLAYFLEGITSDLTEEEKNKLRELIEQFVIPNLKITVEAR
jgi:hypothetical protein